MDFYRIDEKYISFLQRYEDEKYRILVNKEYRFCIDNAD